MTTDSQTDFLYLADSLPQKYPDFYRSLKGVLDEQAIKHDLIPGTRDVWAVDYMPIQKTCGEFIQFIYNPDYLRNSIKWRKTISDVGAICDTLSIKTIKCEILLDGGNLIRTQKKAIICDKIFSENPSISRKKLIKKLMESLEIEELVIISRESNDFTGHADGMVRFYDDHTVLINDYSEEDRDLKLELESTLSKVGLTCIRVPYNPYENRSDDDANGTYLNFLQMKGFLLIPVFNKNEDELVLRLFDQLYPKETFKTINCTEIARDGGILNCISWNIKMKRDEF